YFITTFGKRPLHLIGGAGVFCFAAGGIGMTYLSARWVLSRVLDSLAVFHLHETAIFYYCILAVLLGAQFMLAGLLAEFIVSNQARSSRNGWAPTSASIASRVESSTRSPGEC
ncbi:MAG: glycosyltransferase, partial [Planctomycetota bacterium]